MGAPMQRWAMLSATLALAAATAAAQSSSASSAAVRPAPAPSGLDIPSLDRIADVDQGGLTLPNRDYYLKTEERSKALLQKYRAHVGRMLAMSGMAEADASHGADAVLAIETALAASSLDIVARREPHNNDHP